MHRQQHTSERLYPSLAFRPMFNKSKEKKINPLKKLCKYKTVLFLPCCLHLVISATVCFTMGLNTSLPDFDLQLISFTFNILHTASMILHLYNMLRTLNFISSLGNMFFLLNPNALNDQAFSTPFLSTSLHKCHTPFCINTESWQ